VFLVGYGDRNVGNRGVHDDVSATALVLDDGSSRVAIVALDLLTINEHTAGAVRRLLAPIEVVLCCSHTHSGPIAYADERSSRRSRGFVAVLVDRIVAAVNDAAANLVPARIDFGESVAEVGINRRERGPDGRIEIGRNPDGACDRSVQVVGIWGDDGGSSPRRLATLVNHACHGTTLGPSNLLVSADWIGSMRDRVEAELGGLVVFLQGAGANINPDVGREVGSPFDQTAEVGERVADAVLDAAAGGVEMLSAVPLRITRTDVWLPTQADAITEQPPRTYIEPLLSVAGLPRFAAPLVEPLLRRRYPWRPTIEARNGRWAVPMRVNALRIGDLGLVTFAAETFTEIGLAAKSASPATRTLFASVADGCVSYLATAEAHAEGGYEVDVAPWAYRYPARLAPEGAQLALDVTAAAMSSLWE
jgi:hypothetical protein